MTEDQARALDDADPLSALRLRFRVPPRPDGRGEALYFCGHSLGLMPVEADARVNEELDKWARLGVEGHFHEDAPWYAYHELLREPGARLVGASPSEVVFMNGLTVNLHLMLSTFYRPTPGRDLVLIDEPTFPSDRFAVVSHVRQRGLAADRVVGVGPRPGEHLLRFEDVEEALDRVGDRVAVVLFAGVNFLTGQRLDIARITRAARARGCLVGWDLAHAVGNVPLSLHDDGVDFAVWCSYKYLNGGPGAPGGCFVHSRHAETTRPRLAGWWGNDPATRFRMQLDPDFVPVAGADGWQLSNPAILSMAPLRASLALFDEAGMGMLRARSERLTGGLVEMLSPLPPHLELLTPLSPQERGCQLSFRVLERPREALARLQANGVVCDFREPDVIRVAPVPLYNTHRETFELARLLRGGHGG